ncbi:MAG: tryptophan--tRNA ligase [Candidatus Omnitrophica bacterium]|nr:tryptophan--tRNA ligase [Candidatus Omnitrophota bacterium]
MKNNNKKILLSGVAPTGNLTIGNYIGALKNWSQMQAHYDCLFIVVDMHSITVRQDPSALRERSLSFAAQYLASGIDPEQSIIFIQSNVPAHAELAWILNCFTNVGELNRMTQFKDKARKYSSNVNAGLYVYPVLMAADILLYQTNIVPIGDDQRQHLELTRNIASRFNNLYGKVFQIPEPYISRVGARIMSLLNPERKMDKSDLNSNNYIALLDGPSVVLKKIRQAVTDSGREIKVNKSKLGISNLLTIYSCLSGIPIAKLEEQFKGKNYAGFKKELAELIIETLRPIQNRYEKLIGDKEYILTILKQGAEKASERAEKTLKKVKERVGFISLEGGERKG